MFTPKMFKNALRFLGEHFMPSIHHSFLIYKESAKMFHVKHFRTFSKLSFINTFPSDKKFPFSTRPFQSYEIHSFHTILWHKDCA